MFALGRAWRRGFQDFGHDIAGLVNTVFLFIAYVLGVGLTSLVAKMVGKHFLNCKPRAKTYWQPVREQTPTEDELYRQF
jgi:hypothetical protein